MVALVSQENVVALVSRTGRQLQRYRKGRRQVVGFVSSYSSPVLQFWETWFFIELKLLFLIHVPKFCYPEKTRYFSWSVGFWFC